MCFLVCVRAARVCPLECGHVRERVWARVCVGESVYVCARMTVCMRECVSVSDCECMCERACLSVHRGEKSVSMNVPVCATFVEACVPVRE